jgi:hypothetical protein
MAAEEVQRLDLKDLDGVLARAKAERWTELALVGAGWNDYARELIGHGLRRDRIFVHAGTLRHVPKLLAEITSLTALVVGERWSVFPGQFDKLGSPRWKDEPDDGKAEALFGGVQGEGGLGGDSW